MIFMRAHFDISTIFRGSHSAKHHSAERSLAADFDASEAYFVIITIYAIAWG